MSPPLRVRLYLLLKDRLGRPGVEWWMIAASLLLMSTCLDTGLAADDLLHGLVATQSDAIPAFKRHPLDMFHFTDATTTPELMREGIFSWWTDPNAQLSFFRPISSLTHYLDYLLWPNSPFMMHLQCMLWGLVVFLGVRALYRHLDQPGWVAMLALYLYVLDDARGWFGSWVAARNAVVATAFSVWALVYFHRRHVEGYRPGTWLTLLFLLLGLLSGEGALSICAYMFAHALFVQQGPLAQRLRSLAAPATLAVAWRIAYVAMGYGVRESGLYVDPVGDPVRFMVAFLERAPVLLVSQLGGPWSDVWSALFVWPRLRLAVWSSGLALLIMLGYVMWPVWKRDPLLRFGAVGGLLAVVPPSATFPSDRLLSWVAVGASLALARLLRAYFEDEPGLRDAAPRRLLLPLLVLHVMLSNMVIAPPVLASRARGNMALRDILERADGSVPDDPSLRQRAVVFLNPPAVPLMAYIPIMRAAQHRNEAQSWRMLATGTTDLTLERLDEHTLRVTPSGGFLFNPASALLRVPNRGFAVGQRVDLPGWSVTIAGLTPDGRPGTVDVRFDRSMSDPSLLWMCWDRIDYSECEPPPIGETKMLRAVDYFPVMFGNDVKAPIEARVES